jgi:3-oxoacyl-[acyl-carrier-protein] synthase III
MKAVITALDTYMSENRLPNQYFECILDASSASVPLALKLANQEGKVKKGNRLLLIGFGGGLTYAGMIVEW